MIISDYSVNLWVAHKEDIPETVNITQINVNITIECAYRSACKITYVRVVVFFPDNISLTWCKILEVRGQMRIRLDTNELFLFYYLLILPLGQ